MYYFYHKDEVSGVTVEYMLEEDGYAWPQVVNHFQDFLSGVGFVFDKTKLDFQAILESEHDKVIGKEHAAIRKSYNTEQEESDYSPGW